jgi:hypothetical protein
LNVIHSLDIPTPRLTAELRPWRNSKIACSLTICWWTVCCTIYFACERFLNIASRFETGVNITSNSTLCFTCGSWVLSSTNSFAVLGLYLYRLCTGCSNFNIRQDAMTRKDSIDYTTTGSCEITANLNTSLHSRQ